MQRIILFLICFCCKTAAVPYPGYVALVAIDTLTGTSERVLLVLNEQSHTPSKRFCVKVHSIRADDDYPEITWVDVTISYKANPNDDYQCIQKGEINSSHLYRFSDSRYILAFDVLDQIDESVFLKS